MSESETLMEGKQMLYVERNQIVGGVQTPAPGSTAGYSILKETSMNGTEIGIAPNGASPKDYRDDLRELLDKAHTEQGLTRYRLCKQMGIDSGTLSNVLAKRRHFSIDKLEQILDLLGYRLNFSKNEGATVRL